jgi:hypothetical protein
MDMPDQRLSMFTVVCWVRSATASNAGAHQDLRLQDLSSPSACAMGADRPASKIRAANINLIFVHAAWRIVNAWYGRPL